METRELFYEASRAHLDHEREQTRRRQEREEGERTAIKGIVRRRLGPEWSKQLERWDTHTHISMATPPVEGRRLVFWKAGDYGIRAQVYLVAEGYAGESATVFGLETIGALLAATWAAPAPRESEEPPTFPTRTPLELVAQVEDLGDAIQEHIEHWGQVDTEETTSRAIALSRNRWDTAAQLAHSLRDAISLAHAAAGVWSLR